MLFLGHGLLAKPYTYGIPIIILGALTVKKSRQKLLANKIIWLFGYFYIGFWIICLFFKGTVWSYYYWPFMPIAVLALISLSSLLSRRVFLSLVGIILVINLGGNITWLRETGNFIGQNPSSWRFHLTLAKDIFANTNDAFGYYVYTPDQYGYSPRYAMIYENKLDGLNRALPFEKKAITYLLIAPDSPDNPYTSAGYWKQAKVKIASQPFLVVKYPNGYKVEKYDLSPTEINIANDPTLINNLYFR